MSMAVGISFSADNAGAIEGPCSITGICRVMAHAQRQPGDVHSMWTFSNVPKNSIGSNANLVSTLTVCPSHHDAALVTFWAVSYIRHRGKKVSSPQRATPAPAIQTFGPDLTGKTLPELQRQTKTET